MKSLTICNEVLIDLFLKLLQRNEIVTFVVKGNSMYPFLRNNQDYVKIVRLESGDLKWGQIVLFRYENRYLLHRIIRKKGTNYYLRGDNNWSFHLETCKKEDVCGIVVKVNRNGHEINCDSWQWRFLSLLWVKTHKCRVCLYTCYCYLRKVRK